MADFVAVGTAVGATLSGSATTSASPAKSTTTGNFIVVAFTHYTSGVNVTGVTDTAGNSYIKAGTTQGGDANQDNKIWFTPAKITGHASNVVTVTTSGAASFRDVAQAEFSHPSATSIAFDAEASHALVAVVTNNYTSGSLTTTATDDLIIGNFVAFDNANPLASGAGGTILWESNTGGADDMVSAYLNADAPGSYAIALGGPPGDTNRYSIIAKALKAVTGGASPSSYMMMKGLG